MSELLIDLKEIKRLKLSLNEYLTLLHFNNFIEYSYSKEDIDKLVEKDFLKVLANGLPVLTSKSVTYFESGELFEEFYYTFPHKVPGRFGEERPLRNESTATNGALVTKGIFKKKTKGNQSLQRHIIDVLQTETSWRENNNSLQYMNNIDTWLRQNNWEKYGYLLNSGTENKKLL